MTNFNKKKFKTIKRKIRYFFLYYILKFILKTAKYMPECIVYKFCECGALLFFYSSKKMREITLNNLNKAFGEKPDNFNIAKNTFLNIGRNTAEMAMWGKYNKKKLLQCISIKGIEHLTNALEKNKGVMILTAHCGNWEFVNAYFFARGYTGKILARRMHDERIEKLLKEMREFTGSEIIDRDSFSRDIFKTLKANGMIGMLADQDIKNLKSVFVNFFGHPAYTPVSPVMIALTSGCAVLPTFISRDEKCKYKHKMIIHPELEFIKNRKDPEAIIKNTQLWSDCVENHIRKYPDQWVWFHRRWKTTPEKLKEREKESAE